MVRVSSGDYWYCGVGAGGGQCRRALSNTIFVLDDVDCDCGAGNLELLNNAPHYVNKILNVLFRRIKRRHESHF